MRGHAQATHGMKIDNGLGELPHYRDWVDPSGRAPMEPMVTAEIDPLALNAKQSCAARRAQRAVHHARRARLPRQVPHM